MAIATVTEYKAYANISGSGEDAFLAVILAAAEDQITRFCNRTNFNTGTYAENHSAGSDQDTFTARVYPITSITSLKRLTGTSASATMSTDAYTFHASSGIVKLWGAGQERSGGRYGFTDPMEDDIGERPAFVQGTLNYELVYVAGYASDAMPAALKFALYRVMDGMRSARGRDPLLTGESIGAYSVQYAAGVSGSPGMLATEIQAMLRPFVREGS